MLDGHARFVLNGEAVDAPQGTLVALPPHVRRQGIALADGTTVLAIGATRGERSGPAPGSAGRSSEAPACV